MKRCTACTEFKSHDKFCNKTYPRCKSCDRNAALRYKDKDPDRFQLVSHKKRLKHAYGLDYDDYLALVEKQNGVCKLCERENQHGWNLAVDHDHTTGRIRGLLCNSCNRAIGLFKDRPSFLDRASDYLKGQLE